MDAIILAGGFGTRLKRVISDVPKPLAPINGKPFLQYLMDFLNSQNNIVDSVILSLGYMSDKVINYFNDKYKDINVIYSVEKEPLGTGGAIKQALDYTSSEDVFILNGDAFFDIDLKSMSQFYVSSVAELVTALKKIDNNAERYGFVEIDESFRIIEFSEKNGNKSGYINGGVYILKKEIFKQFNIGDKFSFEKDFIEKYFRKIKLFGYISNGYFIDIGIPEDYERAKKEIGKLIR